MKLLTTTIGAYPKPEYVELPDWFGAAGGPDTENPTAAWAGALARLGDDAEEILARGTREVIDDQVSCGIDIPSDGEVRRENYIHYHCRHLNGIDFEHLTRTSLRKGAYSAHLPTVTGPVSARDHFLPDDWRVAQSFTDRPVKITMPGPMTIADTTANTHYDDPAKLGADLADALNYEVMALAHAGCKHIQIDEPVFARKVPEALDYGLENLERAFHGCPKDVVRTLHMCCGYPDALDRRLPGSRTSISRKRWIAPLSWQSRSKTPIAETTSRCWSALPPRPSSSASSPSPKATWRASTKSARTSPRPSSTSTPSA